MSGSHRVWVACVAVLLAGCTQETPAPAADAAAAPGEQIEAAVDDPVDDAVDVDAPADEENPAGSAGFDITALPMSTQTLGEFPFFSIPDGYGEAFNTTRRLDFGEAAFWTGSDVQRIEGRVYATSIRVDREQSKDKQFSDLEVVRNLEGVVIAAGGVEVFAGESPREVGDEISAVMKQYRTQVNCYGFSPEQLFVLRREDGNVWVRTCRSGNFAGLIVVQEQALQVTSTLLPASALQKALVDDGRVAVQVHFATDRAEILPDSLPQIAQVVELLKADPALALSIEGHTDNTGDAARNRSLSEARAQSVVTAITAAGIAADRLEAAGHGDSRPVADNATEAGRAENRRVELVRQD